MKSGEVMELKTSCTNAKDLPFLKFNLVVSVFTKMLHQEVSETLLRSGKVKIEKYSLCIGKLEKFVVDL